ncbi:hypothetical protein H9639_13885 [Arthrobacter sp. Sa2CUA1]|uniref:Uncharacterized protein n=1 Tax=Arthrobacter gallicola TaxID=2762225 RepID=A0ABR8UVH4_9MICC|nr:hypothetical protein [Arthrobacter gallicola]MBD7996390.1 hypothetical protein [Arthrobacter gallicola]
MRRCTARTSTGATFRAAVEAYDIEEVNGDGDGLVDDDDADAAEVLRVRKPARIARIGRPRDRGQPVDAAGNLRHA